MLYRNDCFKPRVTGCTLRFVCFHIFKGLKMDKYALDTNPLPLVVKGFSFYMQKLSLIYRA